VRWNGNVFSLSDGFGQFNLSGPNPNNPEVFTSASVGFILPGGSANLMLHAPSGDAHSAHGRLFGPGAPVRGTGAELAEDFLESVRGQLPVGDRHARSLADVVPSAVPADV
jgi:hypothetical protein